MATEKNFKHTIGDTKIFNLTVEKDGVAFDLTGATITLTVKATKTASTNIFQKVITTHTTPLEGKTTIEVEPADTSGQSESVNYYDIQISKAGQIFTLFKGQYTLTYEITT